MPRIDIDGPANVNLPTTAETVVATLSGVNTSAGARVDLIGNVQVNVGVGATTIQLRIRRGTTTAGVLVGTVAQAPGTPGSSYNGEVQGDDFPGELSGGSYVLTAQQVAATGNGTAVASNLRADF